MIGLLDYGLGNISAFENIYKRLNIKTLRVDCRSKVDKAAGLILPGVGSFDWAMTAFRESGLIDSVCRAVQVRKTPVLGVCVGMQMMAPESEEGRLAGLGWIPGKVKKFSSPNSSSAFPLPHMGWNSVQPVPAAKLFSGIADPKFYFLHSYHFCPEDPKHAVGKTEYGGEFVSAIRDEHIWATQFHPEKSHNYGAALLKNFAEECMC